MSGANPGRAAIRFPLSELVSNGKLGAAGHWKLALLKVAHERIFSVRIKGW